METYLIDSNVIIDYLANKIPEEKKEVLNQIIDLVPKISILSQIEILGYDTSKENQNILSEFISQSEIFNLTPAVTDICINLRKSHKIKIPDAIIASTALANNFTLITRNQKDFDKIKNLKILNPHT
jgi:predicted nucleic acid-binding protein